MSTFMTVLSCRSSAQQVTGYLGLYLAITSMATFLESEQMCCTDKVSMVQNKAGTI